MKQFQNVNLQMNFASTELNTPLTLILFLTYWLFLVSYSCWNCTAEQYAKSRWIHNNSNKRTVSSKGTELDISHWLQWGISKHRAAHRQHRVHSKGNVSSSVPSAGKGMTCTWQYLYFVWFFFFCSDKSPVSVLFSFKEIPSDFKTIEVVIASQNKRKIFICDQLLWKLLQKLFTHVS